MMLALGSLGSPAPGAQDAINAAAAKYGISPSLLTAVATQESGLNQSSVSTAGAIGVMQLMPGTAARYGANPYDLNANIDAGAHYLSDMLARYNGDVSLALAAYNAGPGNVDRYGGIPPFPETQSYVSSVLAMAGIDSTVQVCDPTVDPTCPVGPVVGDNSVFGIDSNVFTAMALGLVLMFAFGGRR